MNFLLTNMFSDFQLKMLELIQHLHKEVESANKNNIDKNKETIITLQYTYIQALLNCTPKSITKALDLFCECDLLEEVRYKKGACSTYRYNKDVYNKLVSEAKKNKTILTTGRNKQKHEVTASTVLKYMTGKSIVKGRKSK